MLQKNFIFFTGLFISLVINPTAIYAQPAYTLNDSIQIFSLLDKADELNASANYEGGLQQARQALQLSNRKKMLRGQAYAQLKIADCLNSLADIKELGRYDSAALDIGIQLKDSLLIALSYYQLGVYNMSNHRNQSALLLFQKSLATSFEKDQSLNTATVYNDIGFNYGDINELDKQMEWYLKAMRVYEKINDPPGLARTVSNLSVNAIELGRKQDAIAYAKMAIAIREKLDDKNALSISYNNISQIYLGVDSLDQAIKYQELGYQNALKSGLTYRLIQSYITMSLILNRQRKNAESFQFEKKAIALLEQLGDSAGLSRRYIAAATGSNILKDSVGAISYFQKAHRLSLSFNNKINLRDLFYHQTLFYKDRGDFYNAYQYIKKYFAYRDSLINEETNTRIADLELQYQTEKKDNEITALNADQKIKKLQIEKQNAVISGNTLEAKQKQNEIDLLSKSKELLDVKIKAQDEELEKNLLIAKTNEQQLQLAAQEKKLREKELQDQKQLRNIMVAAIVLALLLGFVLFNRYQLKRKLQQQKILLEIRNNIAKDLHDEIGSTLTSIKILSEVSKNNLQKDQQKASALLQKITEQSSQMQQGMSDIVWAIKPDNDKLENMVIRMREYISHTLEVKNIHTSFTIDEKVLSKSIGMEQRRDFFLIFKEAINNTAKYARCNHVKIDLVAVNGSVKMTIVDDGIGFDDGKITSSNGLKNMKSRAEALNGNCTITSVPGQGASISVLVPAT